MCEKAPDRPRCANRPHGRAPQILKLLNRHGPLSVRGLTAMMEPKIERRRLQIAITRLYKRRLIERFYDRMFRGAAVFYRITKLEKYWPDVALVIGQHPKTNFEPPVRPVNLLHLETCAVWANHFERLFPNSIAVRKFQIRRLPLASELLQAHNDPPYLLPDIFLIQPSNSGKGHISLAINVEEYAKSDERTIEELKKFSCSSDVDGVIWLCDVDGVADRLKQLYTKRVMPRADRINNYGHNFMLFHEGDLYSLKPNLNLRNAANKEVKIIHWMNTLLTFSPLERRDANFDVGYPGAPQLQNA